MIDIKTGTKAKKNGTGGGSATKTTYINGTISEADHATRADKAKRAEAAEQAEYAVRAGTAQTANYAQKAGDLSETAEVLGRYVRNDIDNPVHGTLTFEQVQRLLKGLVAEELSQFRQGATFGDFISGILTGTGGRIDELGNAELESITARSSIVTKELITNRQTAIESSFFATESGSVETVTEIPPMADGGSTTYELKLKKRWDGDYTAFHEQDCIRASINTLMENGKYYDMWLRVLSVNTAKNSITVVMYPDDEVPSKKNYPPCELARLIRWGNPVDKARQRVWYLSADTGTIVLLNHVTKPIIDRTNYSIAIGLLPDSLSFVFQDYPTADPEDGAIYTKWIAAENFVRKDYEGNVKREVVDRGRWSLATARGDTPYRSTNTEVHDVWYYGCRWRCLEDGTELEPMYSSQGWAFVEGNPQFEIDISSSNGWRFTKGQITASVNQLGEEEAFTILSISGMLYNQDVTQEMVNVTWTRDTGNPAEDNNWAEQMAQRKDQLTLPMKGSYLGSNWGRNNPCVIRCSAEIRDGETLSSEMEVEF